MMPGRKKIFFSNLDGVRGIAALTVVIWHIEKYKNFYGFKPLFYEDIGFYGVSIFLTLSGFLITYLLLEERRETNTVDLKSFYMRRILRIWPLYFALLLFGYFIYPANFSFKAFGLCVFFLPNIASVLGLLPELVDPLWTIGVEEQFYLIQPHILRIKKLKHVFIVLVSLLFLIYVFKELHVLFPNSKTLEWIKFCLYFFRYDNLIFGSLGAMFFYLCQHESFNKKFRSEVLFSKTFQYFVYASLVVYFILRFRYPVLMTKELMTFIFSAIITLIIINLARSESSIFSLKNPAMNHLGKISYGLYLLHKFPLFLILHFSKKYFSGSSPIWINIAVYAFTIVISIIIAGISYKYFESYFLKLKHRYEKFAKQPGHS